jgi:antitoxin component YwqK of YwqJK toxin-antitoxin module
MKRLLFLLLLLGALACNNSSSSVAVKGFDSTGFTITAVPGSDLQHAIKKDGTGSVLEEGYLKGGVKTGSWVTYVAGSPFPKKIETFVNGNYTGVYMEFNERGQLELVANYLNNKLNGNWGKYRFGRPQEEASYKNGELDGTYKKYFERDGKLQTTIEYKDGVQDGYYRFYDDGGNVKLEYLYKDGEKVEGGIKEGGTETATE